MPNTMMDTWASGGETLGTWLSMASSHSAEIAGRAGFDYVCVDMQHGVADYQVAVEMMQAIEMSGGTPIVRVPWNEPGIIGRVLDAGARGVVVPMVNSVAEAQAAVTACKYPLLGARSFGAGARGRTGSSRGELLRGRERHHGLHSHDRDPPGRRGSRRHSGDRGRRRPSTSGLPTCRSATATGLATPTTTPTTRLRWSTSLSDALRTVWWPASTRQQRCRPIAAARASACRPSRVTPWRWDAAWPATCALPASPAPPKPLAKRTPRSTDPRTRRASAPFGLSCRARPAVR